MKHVFLAFPAYGHGGSLPTIRTILAATASAPDAGIHLHWNDGNRSLLNFNFNILWASALNMREEGTPLEWFVMLHADIATVDPFWLPKLIETAEVNNLDALSAVACIKDASGDTSTALWREGNIHRLSKEELKKWPAVATNAWVRDGMPDTTLLVNTGMLALRLGQDWNTDGFWFDDENAIERGPDGKWRARVLSEDWRMSLWFADKGIPYGVTQSIPTIHSGVWHWETDLKEE